MVRSLRRISARAGAPTASHSAAASTQSPERAPRIRQTGHYSSAAGGREPPSSVGGGARYGPTAPSEPPQWRVRRRSRRSKQRALAEVSWRQSHDRLLTPGRKGRTLRRLPAPSEPPRWWRGRSPRSNGGHSDARLECGEAGCGNERAVAADGVERHHGQARAGRPALEAQGALDREHQLEVQRVARVTGDDVAHYWPTEKGEVSDEVENLVPHELVTVAKPVQDTALAHADGVLQRCAASQAVLAHQAEILQEAVRAGGGELLDEHALARRAGERLGADRGMVVVERVADAERLGGDDLDPAPTAAHPDRVGDLDGPAWRRLLRAPRRRQQSDERLCATVPRRDFPAVDLDGQGVGAEPRRGRPEGPPRLNPRPVAPDGRRVMAVDDALRRGGNRLVVARYPEGDAGVGRRGRHRDPHRPSGVKTDAVHRHRLANRPLVHGRRREEQRRGQTPSPGITG